MAARCKMKPLPIVIINTSCMLQDLKDSRRAGRCPQPLRQRSVLRTTHSSGSVRLTICSPFRHVTHQLWVTGALRGPGRSDSLPLGRAAETCPCPLNSHGWKPVGCAGQGRERPQRMPSLLLFSELSMGTPWQGLGT